MGYAVYHTEKGKISSGGIGNHIDRKEGAEHTYRHSDPEKRNLNQSFIITEHCRKPLHQAIADRISEGYSAKNKAGELKQIRKDAVKYSTHILTGTHEDMKRIEANPEELKKWIQANLKFVSEEFGKENIVRFVLHRDEKTPHLHVVTVNLTKDGRLSAKEILGNPKAMQARQDRYASQMMQFGLERGIRNTGIKHENATEYYARMNQAKEVAEKTEIKVEKGLLGYKAESVQELENYVKSLKVALKSKDLEIETKERRVRETAERNQALKKGKDIIQSNYTKLISDEKLYQQERTKAIEQIKKDLVYEVGKKVQYKFGLKFENNDQRAEYAMKQIEAILKEKNMPVPLVNEAMKDQETARNILEKIEKREQKQEQNRNRGIGR